MNGLVYKATNKETGKSYIGQTIKGLKARKAKHKYISDFHKAIVKHGFDAFQWSILENEIDKENLLEKESYWIDKLDTVKNGYNMLRNGYPTQENLRKISEAKKKPEYRKKLSEANIKRYKNPNERMKTSEAVSKIWIIRTPQNEPLIINGLNRFCRENDLVNLVMWNIANRTYKKYRTCKGFSCYKPQDILQDL